MEATTAEPFQAVAQPAEREELGAILMEKYMAWEIEASTHVYRASEADAERADMRAGFQLELASKDARIAELEKRIAEVKQKAEMCACAAARDNWPMHGYVRELVVAARRL